MADPKIPATIRKVMEGANLCIQEAIDLLNKYNWESDKAIASTKPKPKKEVKKKDENLTKES